MTKLRDSSNSFSGLTEFSCEPIFFFAIISFARESVEKSDESVNKSMVHFMMFLSRKSCYCSCRCYYC